MVNRTRYFVIASLLVLGVGLATGLVAFYMGFPAGAFQRRGPEELQYIPRDAALIAYADVQHIMTSELRQKLRRVIPLHDNGQREFQDRTGINIETDIDRVVACVRPDAERGDPAGMHTSANLPGSGMVLARGRFDEVRIEALMREHGAHVENYNGKRVVVANVGDHPGSFGVAFVEPGLVAVGTMRLVHAAIDLHQGGDNPQTGVASATGNDELMNLVRSLDAGNAWAVGRFDALTARANLPQGVAERLPPITWFSASSHVNGGLSGVVRAEARDEEAASNLRDVVRGFLALAKMQAGSRPDMQAMIQSLELGGTGKTVALSFAVPAEIFDAIAAFAPQRPERQ
jgi:hypothetical protein